MVDKNLVLRKLTQLEEYLGQIREYSQTTVQEYSDDWKVQRIIERTLQMMIELCIDIAGHIISDAGFRIPTSYADTFKVLHESGLIDEQHFQVMEKMAKFGNVVVHHYDKVDEAIVVTILRKHLGDFLVFRDVIVKRIRSEG